MIKTSQIKTTNHWLWSVSRIFVGLVLIATGTRKGPDKPGFVTILDSCQLQPHWVSLVLAYTLPFIELGIGICLLMAVQCVPTAWMAVGLHSLMLSVVVITLKRGIEVANCGCFGVFLARPLTTITLVEDAVMLAMSLLVLLGARRRRDEFTTFLPNDGL